MSTRFHFFWLYPAVAALLDPGIRLQQLAGPHEAPQLRDRVREGGGGLPGGEEGDQVPLPPGEHGPHPGGETGPAAGGSCQPGPAGPGPPAARDCTLP